MSWFGIENSAINAYWNSQIMVWESLPAIVLSIALVVFGLAVANLTGWPAGWERSKDMRENHAKFVVELRRSIALLLIVGILSFGVAWLLSSTGYGCCNTLSESFVRMLVNAIVFPVCFFGMIGLAIGFVFVWTRIFR